MNYFPLLNLIILKKNYIFEKNNSEDIKQLVIETMQKYENQFDKNKVDRKIQDSLWNKFLNYHQIRFENIEEFRKFDNRICNSLLLIINTCLIYKFYLLINILIKNNKT